MKKVILVVLAAILLMSLLPVPTAAAAPKYTAEAQKLNQLGLFKGTGTDPAGNPKFDLDRAPTRAEALAMLIRILGEEKAALSSTATHPFTDVPTWADRYVAYAYETGITTGVGGNKFGSNQPANATQYLTFMLRALGYDDKSGDFLYNKAHLKAAEVGLIAIGSYTNAAAAFLRDDCVKISYTALTVKLKNSDTKLIDKLLSNKVVSDDAVTSVGLLTGGENLTNYIVLTTEDSLNTYGETTIKLPAAFPGGKVDGIVLSQNGKMISVKASIQGGNLVITPAQDLIPGTTYTIKIFTRNGERYALSVIASNPIYITDNDDNLIRIAANPAKGFNYPYYLYIPRGAFQNQDKMYMVVESNNSDISDVQGVHEERVKQAMGATNGPTYFADRLAVPALVAAFPRKFDFMNEPYMQFLDRKALLTTDEEMRRADLQLTAMIQDAQKLLKEYGIIIEDKVFMTGISSAAKFAQRYAILQPHMVKAVAAGAVAGSTTLPFEEYKGTKLRYPVGVADFEELTGEPFNAAEYKKIAQFFFMGEYDSNDATYALDCYEEEDGKTIRKLFGEDQLRDKRLEKTEQALKEKGFGDSIQCHTYKNMGHSPSYDVLADMVLFFKANSGATIKKIKPLEYGER